MATVYYSKFRLLRISALGVPSHPASTAIIATNVTTSTGLGTLTSDANGWIADGSFTAAAGDVVEFTHATYPGKRRITLNATLENAYIENAPPASFLLEDLGITPVSNAVELHLTYEDTPGVDPQLAGVFQPGMTAYIPFQTGVVQNIGVNPRAIQQRGGYAHSDLKADLKQTVAVPAIDASTAATDDIVWLTTYGHTQTGLAAAIAANPSAKVDFRITEPLTVTANTTIPANMLVTLEADGLITVSGGHTLHIGSLSPHGNKKYFNAASSSDYIILDAGAIGVKWWEWWTGPGGSGSDDSHASAQWMTNGGICMFGNGTFYDNNQDIPVGTTLLGLGRQFSKLRNVTPSGSNPIWKISAGISDIKIRDIYFDQQTSSTASCLEITSAVGSPSQFFIDIRGNFFSTQYTGAAKPLINFISSGSNAETVEVTAKENAFEVYGTGYAIQWNSTNTKGTTADNAFFLGIGANGMLFTNSGWPTLRANDLRGPAVANYDTGVSDSSSRTQANVSVSSGGRLLTIDPGESVTFTDDDLCQRVVMSSRFDSYIEWINPANLRQALISSSVAASSGSSTNANMTVYRQSDPTGLAGIGYHFTGDRGPTKVDDYVDEGVLDSIRIDAGEAYSSIHIDGGTLQGRLRMAQSTLVHFDGPIMYTGSIRQPGSQGPTLWGSLIGLATSVYRGVGSYNGFRQAAYGQPLASHTTDYHRPNLTVIRQTLTFSDSPEVRLENPILDGLITGGHHYDDYNCFVIVDTLSTGTCQYRWYKAGSLLWTQWMSASDPNLYLYSATLGANLMTYSPSGYVGIRNTAPAQLLEIGSSGSIQGAIRLDGITSGWADLKTQAAAGNASLLLPETDGTLVQQNTTSTSSSSTPTATGDRRYNILDITALAAGATFAAPTGTPLDGNRLIIRWKDNGTARTLAWNSIFRAVGVTLPTTTVISKTGYIEAAYNSTDSKWDVILVGVEGVTSGGPATLAAYTTSDTSRTSTTTLTAVSALSLTLTAGHVYKVHFVCVCESTGAGAHKLDFNGGSVTATAINGIWEMLGNDNTTNLNVITSLTAAGTGGPSADLASFMADFVIDVNAGGTLIPRYAQNSSNGSASLLYRYAAITAIDIT